jgi:site-specific DNA recombinase
MKTAAIYARVSSDKQREENTIASQTSALIAFAREQNCDVPAEWVIEDDGYSGASLLRPGLERLRDLAAEGLIQVGLVYAPDRLSRRYAHQILLIEEFARAGVEILFIRSKRAATPEDELLLQFQGMIAEYERAQILERSRRGKRHRARQGQVSVLSGAPFGYRYRRKTDHSAAYYEIDEEQARIVRRVYELYTAQGRSIGAITRQLYERQIPTAKGAGRWESSTVWAMLRNPAYKGTACFGKTRIAPRVRVTRPLRLRGGPRRATAPIMSFLARTGSKTPCRRSSAKRPSLWPRSGWSPTRNTRRDARSRPASRRAWRAAPNAAIGFTGHPRGRVLASSIIIDAWVLTAGAGSAGRSATIVRCARICWMR